MHLYSATHCLGKLRMLIRLIQLQCKFTHFKTQTLPLNRGLWSNLLRKTAITTTLFSNRRGEFMYKKKIGKCK